MGKCVFKIVRSLKQKDIKYSTAFEQIRPAETTVPRKYSLPKVQKNRVPSRSFLDMCNWPYQAVVKCLAKWLKPVRQMAKQPQRNI